MIHDKWKAGCGGFKIGSGSGSKSEFAVAPRGVPSSFDAA